MQSVNTFEILKQVLTSWQVIFITLVIIAYIHLVFYVSRRYRRPRTLKIKKVNLFKKKATQAASPIESSEDDLPASDSNDDLGLEEA